MVDKQQLIWEMIKYEKGSPKRVQHFLKVHAFAKLIGQREGLAPELQEILEIAAIVHDIGIKPSLEKYHSSAGTYQEQEGPAVAEALLRRLGAEDALVERVKFLVGHHHTYSHVEGLDYRILIEADFLVNIYEEGMERAAIESVRRKCFETESGKALLEEMFLG